VDEALEPTVSQGSEGWSESVAGVLIARRGSTRFPNKVFSTIAGVPIVEMIRRRLQRVTQELDLVLATTDREEDDQLEEWAARVGMPCYRGSRDDVATRFVAAARSVGASAGLRVNCDSPFVEPLLVDEALSVFRSCDVDLVSTRSIAGLPYGISAELVRLGALESVLEWASRIDREHVTKALYADRAELRVASVGAELPKRPDLHLTVDTPEDLVRLRSLIEDVPRDPITTPYWGL
jgi:spore coat polysaccharide biosynthesis protein SpsF (cytidylyltransferase family)